MNRYTVACIRKLIREKKAKKPPVEIIPSVTPDDIFIDVMLEDGSVWRYSAGANDDDLATFLYTMNIKQTTAAGNLIQDMARVLEALTDHEAWEFKEDKAPKFYGNVELIEQGRQLAQEAINHKKKDGSK